MIPCEPDHPECSEHGPFILKPESGWKLRSFADHESGLVIVQATNQDKSAAKQLGNGMYSPQSRQHVLEPETGRELQPDEWSSFFDYSERVTQSEDGRFELTSQRVLKTEERGEHYEEHLLDLSTGKSIGPGTSVAFQKRERENMMEGHLRREREKAERQAELDAKPDAATYARGELAKLNDGDTVLKYRQNDVLTRVVLAGEHFEVSTEGSNVASERVADIEGLWARLNPGGEDFLNYAPVMAHGALFEMVIRSTNAVRQSLPLTQQKLDAIRVWDRAIYNREVHPDAYIQVCPRCKERVRWNARYPTHLCKTCRSLEKVDEKGMVVTFTNVSINGGLMTHYWRDGEKVSSDSSKRTVICFIEGQRYVAREARFGGVVVCAEPS